VAPTEETLSPKTALLPKPSESPERSVPNGQHFVFRQGLQQSPKPVNAHGEETAMQTSPVAKVFISYSQQDQLWLERLQVYLKPLEREGWIDRWDDTQISPGTRWREAIDKALAESQVAVLLVSAHFLASDFIAKNELPPLLAKAAQKGTHILPVIVSPCRYEQTPELQDYQSANNPKRTLAEMEPAEWQRVLLALSELIEDAIRPLTPLSALETEAPEGLWYVPQQPTPFFTGRELLLPDLHEALQEQRMVALTGLNGIGKTQVALTYAHRYRGKYSAVLWLCAATHEELIGGVVKLAIKYKLPGWRATEQKQVVAAVQSWLERQP
jgi:hypothetical protein